MRIELLPMKKVLSLIFFLFVMLSLHSCSSEKNGGLEGTKQGEREVVQKQSSGTVAAGESLSGSAAVKEGSRGQSEQQQRNNLPSVVKVKLQMENRSAMDIIKVIAEEKVKDGNALTFKYEWMKNGEPKGEGDSFSDFKRGDKIAVKITSFDGEKYGSSKTLTLEVANTSPRITEHNEIKFDGKIFSYQVKAFDLDGDSLTYTLKEAPQGMTITQNGLITWNVPADFDGKAPVTISVTDGHGGEAVFPFLWSSQAEKEVKRAK
jgi:hypothetical protein